MADKKTSKSKKQPLTDLEKRNKEIEKKNVAFHKLSPMKKRMALAREILSLIEGKMVVPTRGTYCNMEMKKNAEKILSKAGGEIALRQYSTGENMVRGLDWQKIIPAVSECHVCMIGVATIGIIKLGDRVSLDDTEDSEGVSTRGLWFIGGGNCKKILSSFFDYDEIVAMEEFFEDYSRSVAPKESFKLFWSHILNNKGKYYSTKLMDEYLAFVTEQENNESKKKSKKKSKTPVVAL